MAEDAYTFGDTEQSSVRLRWLAELYEPETRELLQRADIQAPRLAVDLGCGPGWSTRLVRDVLSPGRTVGLDASQRYIAEARAHNGAGLEFAVHDVARAPFPVQAPDVMFCRFLLTHVSSPVNVLGTWASVAGPGALLLVHETESLETEHPVLRRYYHWVAQLQQHYGQTLLVGAVLEASFKESGWRVVDSRRCILEKRASDMAGLHVANLRTWRHNAYASQTFDSHEIDALEASLDRIARGVDTAGVVLNGARHIIAQRA